MAGRKADWYHIIKHKVQGVDGAAGGSEHLIVDTVQGLNRAELLTRLLDSRLTVEERAQGWVHSHEPAPKPKFGRRTSPTRRASG